MSLPCTEEQFLKNVAKHEMKIIKDDGLYRHIRFREPGSGCYYFDLLTWPGHLCYTGDMGTYVFQRLEDMFEFFRHDREGGLLGINVGYWTEKLVAVDGNRGGGRVKVFDETKFKKVIGEWVDGWVKEAKEYDQLNSEEIKELWAQVKDEIYGPLNDADYDGAIRAAYDFSYPPGRCYLQKPTWQFTDLWEHDFTEYTHSIIWCLYALAWGIKTYDEAKEAMDGQVSAAT